MQTLRARLTAWYSGALALPLAAFAGVLFLDRRSASYQDLDQRIQSEAALTAGIFAESYRARGTPVAPRPGAPPGAPPGAHPRSGRAARSGARLPRHHRARRQPAVRVVRRAGPHLPAGRAAATAGARPPLRTVQGHASD